MRPTDRRPRARRRAETVTVAVTRDERDALHPELTYGLYGSAPDLGSREQAVEYRDRLDLVIGLHDDLGWTREDDRRRFAITADREALRRWLTDVRGAAERAVRDEHHALRTLLENASPGLDGSRAAAAREAKAVIDGDLETIHACDALLARLPRERRGHRLGAPRRRRRPQALAKRPAPR